MSKCIKELFFTSMLQWHFKLPLGVFRNKYKGFMYKCEKNMNSIANNQMSHLCGLIKHLFGPKNPFFICVIANYFSPFFFDHPVPAYKLYSYILYITIRCCSRNTWFINLFTIHLFNFNFGINPCLKIIVDKI